MRKIAIVVLLTLLAVLAIPVVSATEYYLLPDDSNATCCTAPGNCTNVSVWLNATEGVYTGMFNLTFDANCAEITSYTLNYTCFNQNQVPVIVPGRLTCGYEYLDGATNPALSPCTPGHVHLGNFTICCNTTSPPCQTNLEFNTGTGVWNLGGAVSFTVNNGTFECNAPAAPDIVVDRIDPKYVFADLNNSLFATLTNIGGVDAIDFNVSIVITNDTSTVLYSHDTVISLDAGATTSGQWPCGGDALPLGWWTPSTLENITINVTAYNVIGESNTGNNWKAEYRNTTPVTPDCVNDKMLPDTCYGYRGQHPLTENYNGTGEVIYTYGDHTSKACIANFTIGLLDGHKNQVDGFRANMPAGSVKRAMLYVYYGYRNVATSPNPGTDPRPDFDMTFDGVGGEGNLTADSYHTDIKEFAGSKYQYGTLVYDVTANVTNNRTYTARRYDHVADPHDKKGYAYAMALMIIYDDPSDPSYDTYSVAHGYDRIATLYWGSSRWQYFVDSAVATTTATLSDADFSNATAAKLLTVAIDTTNGTGTDAEFQRVNTGPWDDAAWSKDGGYLSFDRSDVTDDMTSSGIDEVVYFREGHLCSYNGFGAVFALLRTTGSEVEIGIDQPDNVDPQSQFTINITVDPQGNEISAVQYDLYYNTSVVWAEWANPGTFLSQDDATTDVTVLSIDNLWDVAGHTGKITYAETTYDYGTGDLPVVNTPGVLTTIHFSAIGVRGTYTQMDLKDVLVSDPNKDPVDPVVTDCGVTIYDNQDPVANASSKYWVSNVASKFQCFAAVCCCNSNGGYDLPGWGESSSASQLSVAATQTAAMIFPDGARTSPTSDGTSEMESTEPARVWKTARSTTSTRHGTGLVVKTATM
jgi:hypothetical protein